MSDQEKPDVNKKYSKKKIAGIVTTFIVVVVGIILICTIWKPWEKEEEQKECITNEDCSDNLICSSEGTCVQCNNNSDCVEDEVCHRNFCMTPTCQVDEDCPINQVCENHVCVNQSCQNDQDCPVDHNCTNGACVPNIIYMCDEDNPCPNQHQVCENNICVTHPDYCQQDQDCTDDKVCDLEQRRCVSLECTHDDMCPDDEVCFENQCVVPCQCEEDQVCEDNICYDVQVMDLTENSVATSHISLHEESQKITITDQCKLYGCTVAGIQTTKAMYFSVYINYSRKVNVDIPIRHQYDPETGLPIMLSYPFELNLNLTAGDIVFFRVSMKDVWDTDAKVLVTQDDEQDYLAVQVEFLLCNTHAPIPRK